MERESVEGWGVRSDRREADREPLQSHSQTFTSAPHILGGFFLGGGDTDSAQSAVMLHPLIIGIVTVNTSLTIIYWTFLLGDAYFKWLMEPEDKPKKVVTPA